MCLGGEGGGGGEGVGKSVKKDMVGGQWGAGGGTEISISMYLHLLGHG